MRLFRAIGNWLNEHYSEDDRIQIEVLNDVVNNLEIKHTALKHRTELLENDIVEAEKQIEEYKINNMKLTVELNNYKKHNSLDDFFNWLALNVPPTMKKWEYGKGYNPLRESLWPRTKSLHLKFLLETMKFDYTGFKTADELVYRFNLAFNKKFPQPYTYETDRQSYGLPDYWESPDEAIDRLTKRKKGDCDMIGSAKYGLITVMLEDYFPESLWRLRCFIVETISREVHYMLAWVKEGVYDWIPIETTWYNKSFKRAWTENLTLRNNSAYRIMWSFDETTEYERNTL